MTFTAKLGSVLLSLLLSTSVVYALDIGTFEKPQINAASAATYGKTPTPKGYVEFCNRGEEECTFSGGKAQSLALTPITLGELSRVNIYVNTHIRPATDMEFYGVEDYWTYPIDAGDCEDYVLLKKRYLQGVGFSADELLITVVLDEKGEGHAVLTIITNKGDYILDNRRPEILRWNETGYIYLKRQSQEQSNLWVSLQKLPDSAATQIPVSAEIKR